MCVALLSCGGPEKKAAAAPPERKEPKTIDVPRSREADDAARFLAGMPGMEGSPFTALEKEPVWVDHGKKFDQLWSIFEKQRLPGMKEFQATDLMGKEIEGATAFYPFSGPDILTAAMFFPKHKTYLMSALEPPGTVPTLAKIQKRPLAEQLALHRRTLDDLLQLSFFVTRAMDRELRGQVTDGLMTPIIIELARTHNKILGHCYFRLDDNGDLVERDTDPGKAMKNKGVAIEFQREGESGTHKLIYISLNLSDESLGPNQPYQKFVARLKPVVTFLKSTSYMTHADNFKIIRDTILENSTAIVQDDTGIPYRFFTPDKWQVTLYGGYVKPIRVFSWRMQKDLKVAYDGSQGLKDLPFAMGYGSKSAKSNLQVARRKSP